jgi:hypothetical protein
MIATMVAISGLIGLVVTTGLLAWQTRASVKQAEIANATAAVTVLYSSSASLRELLRMFVDYPELRAYFYDNAAAPTDAIQGSRVVSVAEMFCDALEDGLVTNRLVPASESEQDWIGYCCYLRTHSPAIDNMIEQHSAWWPQLSSLTHSPT